MRSSRHNSVGKLRGAMSAFERGRYKQCPDSLYVGHISRAFVFLVVVEVLAHFLKHHAAANTSAMWWSGGASTPTLCCQSELCWSSLPGSRLRVRQYLSVARHSLHVIMVHTQRVKHALDCGRDACGGSLDDEGEIVRGYEGHVVRRCCHSTRSNVVRM